MLRAAFAALALLTAAAPLAPAAAARVWTGLVGDTAAGGYDVVSYFSGKPVEGSGTHETVWQGARWRFASAANLAAFKAAPAKYAPQYGGHCAWAAANDYRFPGDPKYWRVVGGKLYLNYNRSVQREWEQDIPGLVAQADKNWPGLAK